jgi:hypothetical protein
MQHADVQALLATMLDELGCEDFCLTLKFLHSMEFGQNLSTAETLALLTKVAKGKKGYVSCAVTHTAFRVALDVMRHPCMVFSFPARVTSTPATSCRVVHMVLDI